MLFLSIQLFLWGYLSSSLAVHRVSGWHGPMPVVHALIWRVQCVSADSAQVVLAGACGHILCEFLHFVYSFTVASTRSCLSFRELRLMLIGHGLDILVNRWESYSSKETLRMTLKHFLWSPESLQNWDDYSFRSLVSGTWIMWPPYWN